MFFSDRIDAGRQLAARLAHLRGEDVVVLGLPRGGVPVAAQVAASLGAPLDISVVRKLGVPYQPELGMGAIGEDGVRVINDEVMRLARVRPEQLDAVEERERAELERRAQRYRTGRPRIDVTGRTVVVVDDGIATGSTAQAACQVARAHGAARVVLAVPVAPPDWTMRLGSSADELVCVRTPGGFHAIGQFYADFSQTSDEEVVACLQEADREAAQDAAWAKDQPKDQAQDQPKLSGGGLGAGSDARQDAGQDAGQDVDQDADRDAGSHAAGGAPFDDEVVVDTGEVDLAGHLIVPEGATGVVLFAHGSGSSRHSPRNRFVAAALREAGLGTLLFDLLTEEEELDRGNVFDTGLLARRLGGATRWVQHHAAAEHLPVGFFGASTGAAAALRASTEPGVQVAAVVSRGGRPDLTGPRLSTVTAPTLLIVGSRDRLVLDLNRQAQARMRCENRLAIVPGATHLFEEPGTLEAAADLARDWFTAHMVPRRSAAGW